MKARNTHVKTIVRDGSTSELFAKVHAETVAALTLAECRVLFQAAWERLEREGQLKPILQELLDPIVDADWDKTMKLCEELVERARTVANMSEMCRRFAIDMYKRNLPFDRRKYRHEMFLALQKSFVDYPTWTWLQRFYAMKKQHSQAVASISCSATLKATYHRWLKKKTGIADGTQSK